MMDNCHFENHHIAILEIAKLMSPKPKILISDMLDGRRVGKYIIGYNSTTVCLICAKFCANTQNPTAMTVERQKFQIRVSVGNHRLLNSTIADPYDLPFL